MLIESASTRLAIDFLESLRKQMLEITNIRISYIGQSGLTTFTSFATYDAFVTFYTQRYGRINSTRRDPFTDERQLKQDTPISSYGTPIGFEDEPKNVPEGSDLCSVGDFVSLESVLLKSTAFDYEVEYRVRNISDAYQIVKGNSFNLRKQTRRKSATDRHETKIKNFIAEYQIILKRLLGVWEANLYVNLCYVNIGYVEESAKLYKMFFALVKPRLGTGLRSSVLNPRYFRKITR